MEGQEQENVQGQDSQNKDQKKFEAALAKVVAVVGGEKNLRLKKTVGGTTLAGVVADLFKEEEEQLEIKVKNGLKDLLKKYAEVEAEIAKKEQELKSLQTQKRKEFTAAANKWLENVNQHEVNQQAYANALEVAFSEPIEDQSAEAPAPEEQK